MGCDFSLIEADLGEKSKKNPFFVLLDYLAKEWCSGHATKETFIQSQPQNPKPQTSNQIAIDHRI